MDIKQLHEKVLYPIVRVRAENAGGSGTVIYCRPKPGSEEEYESFVLTNHHVIKECIKIKKEWDSLVKKKIDKESTSPCNVEIFNYVYTSRVDAGATYKADIVAYDENHDLALLKLDSPTRLPYVAELFPKGKEKEIKLFTEVWCSGCSLGHNPIINKGHITSLCDVIESKEYLMTSANSIFGNSGGALFLAETGQMIGVPSRVSALQLGFGVDVITWMSFSCPPQRIYEWIDEQELQFLYDETQTPEECFKRRKNKMEKALMEETKNDQEDEPEGSDEE